VLNKAISFVIAQVSFSSLQRYTSILYDMYMPKLDNTHIADRLRERLADLKSDKEVAAREIKKLLNKEQLKAVEEEKAKQKILKKQKIARTKEQQKEFGYKSIREIYIEAYEKAIDELDEVGAWNKKLQDAEVRQMRIYMDSINQSLKDGKTHEQAKNIANNDLTRAGLARMDGQSINQYLNKRDKEVFEMEAQLKKQLGIKDIHDEDET
jgi:CheY-like chemotaxis protein